MIIIILVWCKIRLLSGFVYTVYVCTEEDIV